MSRRTAHARAALALAAALAAGLCACASGRDDAGGDPHAFGGSAHAAGGGAGTGGDALNVFLSPSGEPYRGGREAPYASALWFARADADHDGRLTLAEFRADALRAFALYDTDGNGVIDAFEIQHYEEAVAPEILPRIGGLRAGEGADTSLFHGRGAGRGRGGERPAPEGKEVAGDRTVSGAGLYAMLAEPEPITAADADVSGTVTRAEWLARTDVRFALLDRAGRGYLTLAGLPEPEAETLLERRRAAEAARRAKAGAGPTAPPAR